MFNIIKCMINIILNTFYVNFFAQTILQILYIKKVFYKCLKFIKYMIKKFSYISFDVHVFAHKLYTFFVYTMNIYLRFQIHIEHFL